LIRKPATVDAPAMLAMVHRIKESCALPKRFAC
jgi:hypothetical protein